MHCILGMSKEASDATTPKCVILGLIVKWDFFFLFSMFCSSHFIHLIDVLVTHCLITLKPPTSNIAETLFSDIMLIKMKCIVAVSKHRLIDWLFVVSAYDRCQTHVFSSSLTGYIFTSYIKTQVQYWLFRKKAFFTFCHTKCQTCQHSDLERK